MNWKSWNAGPRHRLDLRLSKGLEPCGVLEISRDVTNGRLTLLSNDAKREESRGRSCVRG